jgi:Domain of unknown function (DUF362)
MNRRDFLRTVAGVSATVAAARSWASSSSAATHLGLHPFVEAHPEAVFVLRTSVADRKDAAGKGSIGKTLAKQLFGLTDGAGISPASKIAVKPNLTSNNGSGDTYAIITDRDFLGGMLEGIKETGLAPGQIYVRDGMGTKQLDTRYHEMAARTGVHYDDGVDRATTMKECPSGVVFKRAGYMGPFTYPDTFVINVAKFKTHSMGLTLCIKNLQGTTVAPWLQFCGGLQPKIAGDFQPDAEKHCKALWEQHKRAEIPRWDTKGSAGMEMWVQRALDNMTIVGPATVLHVIEGISGQNGDAFTSGPGPGGTAQVFLTNFVLFGKDPYRLDILGHWLAGHEPGNFGLFHIAKERRLSTVLNPRNIPIYLWDSENPKLTPLADLEKCRRRLVTPYLAKAGEAAYHLCNEPYTYPSEPVPTAINGTERPSLKVLGTFYDGTDRTAIIEYSFPSPADAVLDICDATGRRVRQLAAGPAARGLHMASFPTRGLAAGRYSCALHTAGCSYAVPVEMLAG